ncbi:MAG: hypothetical protein DIU63_00685 [Proteobacteria bacterium]|jgi:TRAP-type uncharacterized transport system, periplasmic component|nr:MAG: hypothetical protein DIU63_00685 [Pseudomonadota bacterium]
MTARLGVAAAALVLALGAFPHKSFATSIHTAEEGGTYHSRFCPVLAEQLAHSEFAYSCEASAGTAENIRKVLTSPADIGYGQLDIFARLLQDADDAESLVTIRSDDVRQCLFAVTKRRDLQSFGDLSARAPELHFYLPPRESNSNGTFALLQQIDPDGLGKAGNITYAPSAEDAIHTALSEENAVAFFVEFPDPENRRFKLVRVEGGHFVPIVDREVLRQQIGGHKVYFVQETQVANADWLTSARKVVTACTPTIVFTGSPEKIANPKARQDHEDLIATVRAMRTETLLPQESTLARVLARTKELSAASAEKLMQASERAREKAKPYIESAKEATEKAIEAAKPALEKAKDYGWKFYERAREELKGIMDSKPEEGPSPSPEHQQESQQQ